MPSTRLTEVVARACETPRDRPWIIYWDADLPAFGLRVTKGGVRTFIIDFSSAGRKRRMAIGQMPVWSVKAARKRAEELKRQVDQGGDPLKERLDQRDAPLMSELFDRYFSEHAMVHKKPHSIAVDRHIVHGTKHVPPRKPFAGLIGKHFAQLRVSEVDRQTVMRFHAGLRATPYSANRCVALLSKVFTLAELWGYRTDNPCRHVQKFKEHRRERFLSPEELTRLGKALDANSESPRIIAAIRLLLLTGCRSGEILNLRQSDLDIKAGTARLIDTKTGARTLQLSTQAQQVLASLPADGEFVCGGLPYHVLALAWRRLAKAAQLPDATLHTLRHTVASCAAAQNFSASAIQSLLGHRTITMAARYIHNSPARQAVQSVGNVISAAMSAKPAAAVVQIKRHKP